jgi:dienelactone hydrolase
VPIERISFTVAGDTVVGDLHLPQGRGPFPAVIVAGPMTSIKEQVTGVYAAALARRGIAAIAIDHRGYGESGGDPRQYEHWGRKVEDLRAALAYLASRSEIAPERIGAAGVCLGSGYAAHAAADNPLVRAAAFVAGYYRDPAAMRARDPRDFDAKVAQGRAARERYEATCEVATIPAAALEGDAAMQSADTYDYYTRRAAVPNYTNAFAVMSREHFLPFDVQAAAPHLAIPVLMIHSEKALGPSWARQFHDALPGPRAIEWVTSNGQTDFYDDPALIDPAADQLAAHFERSLFEARDP